MTPLNIVVLAAGLGKRMKTDKLKVLHELGGMTLVAHVVKNALGLKPSKVIVVVPAEHESFKKIFARDVH
ncbi:MAG TPA: NTP transferase domain-containing protein, partial [bacterium]|nr:NTP transferase domain-containing protein [bacterium]